MLDYRSKDINVLLAHIYIVHVLINSFQVINSKVNQTHVTNVVLMIWQLDYKCPISESEDNFDSAEFDKVQLFIFTEILHF